MSMPNSVPASTPTTPPSPLPHSRLARSHNRRFHIRFPGVDSEEHLLNYYSCALVADILLQGHLYITENYFAFYSNIFGRKTQKKVMRSSDDAICQYDYYFWYTKSKVSEVETKLLGFLCLRPLGRKCLQSWEDWLPRTTLREEFKILLPVSDVIKVTKERTAKIIPNAVGLYTVEGKYVFGSLLQRNTTYRLMHHVWLKSADPDTTEDEPTPSEVSEPGTSDEGAAAVRPAALLVEDLPPPPPPVHRLSRRKSDLFPRISAKAAARRQCPTTSSPDDIVEQITLSKCHWDCSKGRECFARIEENVQTASNSSIPRSTVVLLAATLILVLLFLLATVLVYRVSIVSAKNSMEDNWPTRSGHRLTNYLELLKQQQEAVEEEILRITATLKNRLNDLGQVRQSIDQMSSYTRSPCNPHQEKKDEPTLDLQHVS